MRRTGTAGWPWRQKAQQALPVCECMCVGARALVYVRVYDNVGVHLYIMHTVCIRLCSTNIGRVCRHASMMVYSHLRIAHTHTHTHTQTDTHAPTHTHNQRVREVWSEWPGSPYSPRPQPAQSAASDPAAQTHTRARAHTHTRSHRARESERERRLVYIGSERCFFVCEVRESERRTHTHRPVPEPFSTC